MARSEKARRDSLRADLSRKGLTVAQIAEEMGREFKVRPRTAWRLALDWTQGDVAREYMLRNENTTMDAPRISKWEAWPYGGTALDPSILAALALAFGHGCTAADLVDDADRARLTASGRYHFSPAPAALSRPRPANTGGALWQAGPDISDIVEAVAAQAAHETWQHLASDATSIEPMGIQVMHEQLTELSRAYAKTPPAVMLTRARQVRDSTYKMLEQTRRPAQLVDLNLAAGMSCALLASASFDLGQHGAALAQIRAADRYADMAGHPGLQAWAGGFAALVAYWDGRPGEAVQVVEAAIEQAPVGTPTARLQSIRARAYALVDDRRRVVEALAAADDALGAGQVDELHDTIGGELGWEHGRHDMCAGTALVTVGDARAAAERLDAAVEFTGSTSFVDPARADLAAARLIGQDLDGAIEALDPVWSVSVDRRRFGFTSRLATIRTTLATPGWAGSVPARNLHDQITEFVTEADEHRALLASGSSD